MQILNENYQHFLLIVTIGIFQYLQQFVKNSPLHIYSNMFYYVFL